MRGRSQADWYAGPRTVAMSVVAAAWVIAVAVRAVVPRLGGAVAILVPVGVAAALAAVRGDEDGRGASVVFAASLLWCLLLLGPAHDSRVIAATIGLAVALLAAARFVARRPRLATP